MRTSLRISGANCATYFNETLADLSHLDGVRAVRGSFGGPCIEIEHDLAALEAIPGIIRDRLHGVELSTNEVEMVPLEAVVMSTPCAPHRGAGPARG